MGELPPSSRAFTLIELLVCLCIIVVLAGLLLPVITMAKEASRRTQCSNNQRQMMLSMLLFVGENEGEYPFFGANKGGSIVDNIRDPDTGEMGPLVPGYSMNRVGYGGGNDPWTAIASLEVLAAWSEGELTLPIFRCPTSKTGPPVPPNPGLLANDGTPPAWSMLSDSAYSYDFGTPPGPAPRRVILADRPIDQYETSHGKRAILAFADGHVATQVRANTSGEGSRYRDWTNIDDWTRMRVLNPLVDGDNIYDPIGDGIFVPLPEVALFTDTKGSSTRAWVR